MLRGPVPALVSLVLVAAPAAAQANLPFAETARAVFGYAGVDVTLARNVQLIPNLAGARSGSARGALLQLVAR